MITNQKGFTYPLTLSLLIVFLFFFSIRGGQLLNERRLFHVTQVLQQQEYYMLTSERKTRQLFQSGGTSALTDGTFTYQYGTMNYHTDPPSGTTQKVTFTLQMNSGEVTLSYAFYDINTKALVKWIEKN